MKIVLLGQTLKTELLKKGMDNFAGFEVLQPADFNPKNHTAANLILMDCCQEPEKNFELVKQLRKQAELQNVPIIFLTEHSMPAPVALSECRLHPIKDFRELVIKLAKVNVGILERPLNFLLLEEKPLVINKIKEYVRDFNCSWVDSKSDDIDLIICNAEKREQALTISRKNKEFLVPIFIISDAIKSEKIYGFYEDAFKSFCSRLESILNQ